jgi:plastocyanin
VIQFNFVHRFEVSPPPARKVTSFPNFLFATGLPYEFNVLLDYSTNSTVFTGIPNEYQLALRRPLLHQSRGGAADVAITAGYNFAPQSVDGELSLARWLGPVRLLGAVRGMSNAYDIQRSLWGVGGGAVVRILSWLSVAGDVFGFVNAPSGASLNTAWGAGAQILIPYTPHTFSIQVTNTTSATLEGSSRGVAGAHMVGFEFTIPITLSRYFGKPGKKPPPAAAQPAVAAGEAMVHIANLSFTTQVIRVRVGTRVRWINDDQVQHTVTAENGAFESGLIDPGRTYERVFDRPGDYPYHCTPHPFMTGRVVVEP